jgi:hypothetical protein
MHACPLSPSISVLSLLRLVQQHAPVCKRTRDGVFSPIPQILSPSSECVRARARARTLVPCPTYFQSSHPETRTEKKKKVRLSTGNVQGASSRPPRPPIGCLSRAEGGLAASTTPYGCVTDVARAGRRYLNRCCCWLLIWYGSGWLAPFHVHTHARFFFFHRVVHSRWRVVVVGRGGASLRCSNDGSRIEPCGAAATTLGSEKGCCDVAVVLFNGADPTPLRFESATARRYPSYRRGHRDASQPASQPGQHAPWTSTPTTTTFGASGGDRQSHPQRGGWPTHVSSSSSSYRLGGRAGWLSMSEDGARQTRAPRGPRVVVVCRPVEVRVGGREDLGGSRSSVLWSPPPPPPLLLRVRLRLGSTLHPTTSAGRSGSRRCCCRFVATAYIGDKPESACSRLDCDSGPRSLT